ncbi:MAG TPA: hypothetical protein VFO84_08940 [Dehalococcoidia bacterium]|nr:hypothetical protein [Dehalococcoidia bacterium]
MIATLRTYPWTGFALLATAVALPVWGILAVYSASGTHISSTAEDVAFVVALLAGALLILAGVLSLQRSGWRTAAVLGAAGLVVLVVTFWFSPTTW